MASAAGNALSLIQDVDQESDELRRKKLIEMQQQRLLPNSSKAGAALGRLNAGYGSILGGY